MVDQRDDVPAPTRRSTPILGSSLDELRRTRTSVKWRFFDEDVLPVWVAEMDASTCPPVLTAVTDALTRGDTGYALPRELATAVAEFAQRCWDWQFDPSTAVNLSDVIAGVRELLWQRTGPVVVSPPCYDAFYSAIDSVGREVVTAPLGADLRLDLDALGVAFAAAGPGATYLLCNPHNPTGTVHTPAELSALARLADEHEVLVISDEIHAPLVHPGVTFTPYLAVPEAAAGVAIVSGSKAFNLAGLKAALAIPGERAHDTTRAIPEVATHSANQLAVIGQTAAFTHGEAWLEELLVELGERRALVRELLATHLPAVRMAPAEATYLAWLDCRELGIADPAAVFRTRGRVALSPGHAYDRENGAGWARLNLATSPEVLTEAVRRMASALT